MKILLDREYHNFKNSTNTAHTMICAACESRKHFECIDCMNNHKTYLCSCDCHDENTKPHPIGDTH